MPQYQGVWTLQAQAQAQSNQQWVTDPNFKNTTLLLQADGTGSGSQNQTFLDSSTNNFFITRNGNTTQGSFSPFSQAPGYWGNYLPGSSGSYLNIAATSAFAWGTGNFTIEFWLYPITGGTDSSVFDFRNGSDTNQVFLRSVDAAATSYQLYLDAASRIAFTLVPNTFSHIAIVRNSGTVTVYVNGVANATTYSSATNYTTSVPLSLSAFYNNTTTAVYGGYYSNFRVVKGTAVYTSNFTPSTAPLTAISGTSLLTCQSNRFVDNSSNAFAITVNGSPSVQAFGPFAPALQWTPDVVGGSGYFDGSGDYLVTPTSAALSSTLLASDFTIECWIYPTTYPGGGAAIWTNSTSNSDGFSSAYITSTGTIGTGKVGVNEFVSTATIVRNAWNHFATVRSGATVYTYLNGVQIASGAAATYLTTSTAKPLQIAQSNQSTPSNITGYIAGYRVASSALYTGSTYTIPTTVPTAISGTQLLLNMTNAGIYDGKMGNVLETVGNAQVSTSPVKYGSGSIYLNSSTSDGLRINEYLNYQFGTGDFTVECWINCLSFSTNQVIFDARGNVTAAQPWQFYVNTSSKLVFNYGSNLTGTISVPTTTWTHVVAARANGILRMFVNGVLDNSVATTASLNGVGAPVYVGRTFDTSGTVYFTGYIDDLRITKGVARYIANFTPPQQALPRQ